MSRTWPSAGRSSADRSHGQALVEFVLVAPLFFLLLIGIFEAGRFVLYLETMNNATREGARYAIVHGAKALCPSGPPPPGEINACDPTGDNVKAAVTDASIGLAATGDLFVSDPVWTSRGSLSPPSPGDASTGNNGRGDYVTVFVDYTYDTMIKQVFNVDVLPTITISAESTLVVNN